MITEDKITEFFCIADDFHKVFDAQVSRIMSFCRKNEGKNIKTK